MNDKDTMYGFNELLAISTGNYGNISRNQIKEMLNLQNDILGDSLGKYSKNNNKISEEILDTTLDFIEKNYNDKEKERKIKLLEEEQKALLEAERLKKEKENNINNMINNINQDINSF